MKVALSGTRVFSNNDGSDQITRFQRRVTPDTFGCQFLTSDFYDHIHILIKYKTEIVTH